MIDQITLWVLGIGIGAACVASFILGYIVARCLR